MAYLMITIHSYNGISDHQDAQLITVFNINDFKSVNICYIIKKIQRTAKVEFSYNLSFQSW